MDMPGSCFHCDSGMQRKAGHVAGRVGWTVVPAILRQGLEREHLAAPVRARNAVGNRVAGQIGHRVVLVQPLAQVKLFGITLQQPLAFQQSPHPAGDGVGQLRELGRGRLAHPLEVQAGAVGRPFVDAIEKQHVEVYVQVQRRAEALDQRDRTSAGKLLRMAGLFDQMRGNDAVDDTEHAADERRVCGQEKSQRKGKT